MLSIFMLFSNDRQSQAEIAIACLRECSQYAECHRILCVDGTTTFHPDGFDVLEIQRPSGLYCWAKMWDEAIAVARHANILYLDCDRILPIQALSEIHNAIQDNCFVFPKWLYSLTTSADLAEVRRTRDHPDSNTLTPDHRIYSSAWDAIRKKNPMSGCVGFTKKTFLATGGLDYEYQGWGYPDTDYFEKTKRQGMSFLPLELRELHLKHSYSEPADKVKAMNLWNGCYFCRKWGYPIHPRLHQIANEINVPLSLVNKSDSLTDFLARLRPITFL